MLLEEDLPETAFSLFWDVGGGGKKGEGKEGREKEGRRWHLIL